jgi:Class II flagellar assembly regulator
LSEAWCACGLGASAKLPLGGKFCRVVYAALTIRRRSSPQSTGEITTMRIYGPNGTTLGSPASNTRRTSSTGFSLPETPATPEETRSAAPPKAAGSIDALLAMQGVEDPTERRKRSVARGRGALDVLDDLKIGLLSGNLDTATMNRLRDAAANLKTSSGDPGLDAVLSEIELRVEVELAKAGQF